MLDRGKCGASPRARGSSSAQLSRPRTLRLGPQCCRRLGLTDVWCRCHPLPQIPMTPATPQVTHQLKPRWGWLLLWSLLIATAARVRAPRPSSGGLGRLVGIFVLGLLNVVGSESQPREVGAHIFD